MRLNVLGRPKSERRFFTYTLSLTLEQIQWLRTFPNASEIVRRFIDDAKAASGDMEKIPILSLKHQMDILDLERERLQKEFSEYCNNHGYVPYEVMKVRAIDDELIYEFIEEKVKKCFPNPEGGYIMKEQQNEEENKFHAKILKGYVEALNTISKKKKELKERIRGI